MRILLTPHMAAFIFCTSLYHIQDRQKENITPVKLPSLSIWGVEGGCAESFGVENMLKYKVEIRI